MNRIASFLSTTVGMKMLVGLTGLGWAFFLLTHMSGNLLLFVGPEAYNNYGNKITSNPLIYIAEAGLLLFLILHVYLTLSLTARNAKARTAGYRAGTKTVKKTSFTSKTMALTGSVILVFTVLHLITFKFGPHYTASYANGEVRDLYQLIVEKFKQPGYVAWYVFAMVTVGMHLSHAFSASLQSLGLMNSNNKGLRRLSIAFAVLVAGGFTAQPLYIFFFGA